MKLWFRWLILFGVIIFFSIPKHILADDLPAKPPGVFPITCFNRVQGTAFLIDQKYGWFLTAGHVLNRCRTTSPGQPVSIQVTIQIPDTSVVISKTVSVVPIAWGYNFTEQSHENEGTVNDWVVLRAADPDIPIFGAFQPFYIDPRINRQTVEQMAREPGQLQFFGFPDNIATFRKQPSDFSGVDEQEDGLWEISGPVISGDSGGPCADDTKLIGIVLQQGTETNFLGQTIDLNTGDINPIYAFIPMVANQIPLTASISNCVSFFQNGGDLTNALVSLYLNIQKLNGIEQWQLLYLICSSDQTTISQFIYNYFADYIDQNRWMVREIEKRLPADKKRAFFVENNRIIENAQANGITIPTPALKAANAIGDMVIEDYTNLSLDIQDKQLVANSVIDSVYLHNTLNALPVTDEHDIAALVWAKNCVGVDSVRIATAYLAAAKGLSAEQRGQLADYAVLVGTQKSNGSTTSGNIESQIANAVANKTVGPARANAFHENALNALHDGNINAQIFNHSANAIMASPQ